MVHKIALVGIGAIARHRHIPCIAESRHFELAATASRNARVDGVEGFSTLAELLDARPDIGCVSLCTPPQVRFGDACLALERGRHLMLEKPPGATLSEVHALIGLARETSLTLFATWHSRHAAAVGTLRDWIGGKTVERVDIQWKEDVRRWHHGQDWIWQAGGLGVFDPGVNALSILTAVFPRPLHLRDSELCFPGNRETPIAARLALSEPGGAAIAAEFDWRHEGKQTWDIRIVAREGEAVLSEGGAKLHIDGIATGPSDDRTLGGEYEGLYARFAELLASGASDTDLAPLRLVADAFLIGKHVRVEPFEW